MNNNIVLNKQHDFAVDIIKFFAVFLIINSHADIMYPKMSILATGGAIGDCLFLFVSGYTLFLTRSLSFGNYYKRRIKRIYPSVFSAILFVHLIKKDPNVNLSEIGGGEFVEAIMIYYVLLFLVRKYAINHIPKILGIISILTLLIYVVWFPFKYEVSTKGIYGISTSFRWIPYFAFMLMGAYMGLKNNNGIKKTEKSWKNFTCIILCLFTFYGIQLLAKKYTFLAPIQIITLIPLMGIVIFFYKWCKSNCFLKIYQKPWTNKLILFVSGICLESYLIQFSLITNSMNKIWPFNILFICVIIIICSYLVRCVAKLFSQTFEDGNYDWGKIISI